jgi:two-component system sensor histidine kinase ChiS
MRRIIAALEQLRLWQKVNGAILLTFALIAITYVGIELPYEQHRLNTAMLNTSVLLKTLIERDQDPLANEIFERRVRAIDLRIQQMRRVDGILEINVYGPDGELLGSDGTQKIRDNVSKNKINSVSNSTWVSRETWQGHYVLRYFKEIKVVGDRIGFIEIFYSLADIESDQWLSIWIVVGLLASILLIMTVLLNLILFRTIIRPITSLSVAMGHVQAGELGRQVDASGRDEIGDLSKAFNQMSTGLKQTDILKDHFLANISHELRTPLHGIIGLSESLLDGVAGLPTSLQAKNLSMIIQSGRRLSSLVDDILDFSKMKHHALQLQLKAVDPRSVAELAIAIAQSLIGLKPVTLINGVETGLPLVHADENRLQQIMLNLIGNAIKFTAAGEIRIHAEVLTAATQACGTRHEMVRLSVTDSGIGIPLDQREKIFEAFEQGDGSIGREYGGTGLGLSICKQLVELHGGTITVESIPGAGSTFSITLPQAAECSLECNAAQAVVNSHPERSAQPPAQPYAEQHAPKTEESFAMVAYRVGEATEASGKHLGFGNQETILIVDDEPVNLQILHNQLNLHNYRTIEARDGVQALEILQQTQPDLILLDLMMPRMTGYEAIRKIRENAELAAVPIIVLTAKDLVSDLVQGFSLGANDFLSKPFRKEELLARIHSQLKLKHAIRHLEEANALLEERVKERTVEFERLAMIDALTGLANRRYFEARAAIELSEARRQNLLLTVLALDIDHFKSVNDSYGHAVGDIVLKQVGQVLTQMVRPNDLVSRIGGEEFTILLPGLPQDDTFALAEGIRAGVAGLAIMIGQEVIAITISIGVATLHAGDPEIAAVHSRADQALYRAKREGRNRVVAA